MGTDLDENFFLCKFEDTFICTGYPTNNGQIKSVLVNPNDSSQVYSITTISVFKVPRDQYLA